MAAGSANRMLSKRTLVIIGCSLAGFLGAFALAYFAADAAGVQLSIHAWIAIGLGALLSFALSGVLFGLSFYSARSGHDDTIGTD